MSFLDNENLLESYKKAKKSRKHKEEVYIFDYNFEENIKKLRDDIIERKYIHSDYKKIILTDSKKRYIHSPVFRDHIFHHMVYSQIYKVFDKKLIDQTYACRKGYGSHKTIKDIQSFLLKTDKTYYLKLDISKYFYSISHDKLKVYILKFIKNEDLKYAINLIIDSYHTGSEFDFLLKDYDKYINQKEKGIPIGSILSQVFANIYLQKLDSFIKHDLKIKGYFRYMDDMLLVGDKYELKIAKNLIIDFVDRELDLFINPKKVSFNLITDGINFVGFNLKNKSVYLYKKTKLKTLKFLDKLSKINLSIFDLQDQKRINSSLNRRLGNFKHTSFGLNYIKNLKTDFLNF